MNTIKAMFTNVKELLASKKFKVLLLAVITAVTGAIQGAVTWKEAFVAIMASAVAYLTAQGIADVGKEKAKIEAGTTKESK